MVINLVAGLFIGIFDKGLSLNEALHTYSLLTVGDGLAAQVPALLTSTAAGVIVSHTSHELDLPATIGKEILRSPGVLIRDRRLVCPDRAVCPDCRTSRSSRWRSRWAGLAPQRARWRQSCCRGSVRIPNPSRFPTRARLALARHPLPGTWRRAGAVRQRTLETCRKAFRRSGPSCATRLGITLPPVRIVDNLALEQNWLPNSAARHRGRARRYPPTMSLAIPGPQWSDPRSRESMRTSPLSACRAEWVSAEQATAARLRGYTVVDALTVLVTHFAEACAPMRARF